MTRGLVIMGCGGHARSVADVALDLGVAELRFVDASARAGEAILGFPVSDRIPAAVEGWQGMPASGDGATRRKQVDELAQRGFPIATLIARDAYVSRAARVGPGAFVAHGAHVGPEAVIGDGAIINTGAVVDHESEVGAYGHVSVNAVVAGRCRIGVEVMIGAGAVVIDGISIADYVLVEDLTARGTYAGNPARPLRGS